MADNGFLCSVYYQDSFVLYRVPLTHPHIDILFRENTSTKDESNTRTRS